MYALVCDMPKPDKLMLGVSGLIIEFQLVSKSLIDS